ncbi:MAG: class I SAM-dependent methyltransferase [Bacteroidia bacterium]|nr:class I SAM-dependent methyltransferase [Bacteroidia bacterium]
MKIRIPYWVKIGAKLVLSRLPFGYSFWQKLGMFRHGEMDISTYAIDVFDTHMLKAGQSGILKGKIILELGPGDSISTAILAAAYNAKAILVDAGSFVRRDVAPYRLLAETLRKKGFSAPDLSTVKNIDEILAICKANYLTNGLQSLKQIDTKSIDIIFSQAVLEHVRQGEFLNTLQECYRILKPKGICSHRVDLRDHLGGALNNLRFSDRVWESTFFVKSGFYTNRIRYNQMLELFKKAGYKTEVTTFTRWETLPTPRHKMVREFRSLTDDDLLVSVFDVLLRKNYKQ